MADDAKAIVLDQVIDSDRALMLLVGRTRPIEFSSSVTRANRFRRPKPPVRLRGELRRIATERACACRPSASPSVMAAAPSAQRRRAAFEDRGALHEIEHAEARGEARRARRRQHMVGAGDIIAYRLRRIGADEDRAGVADPRGQILGVFAGDFQMLGGDAVDERQSVGEVCVTITAPKSRQEAPAILCARQLSSCSTTARLDRVGKRSVVGDEDRLRAGTSCSACAKRSAAIQSGLPVLSARMSTSGGAGDHVDADCAEHQAFGGGHIGVAGPDDLGDGAMVSVP